MSSVSNFETYQTNRLKLRYRDENRKTQLLHSERVRIGHLVSSFSAREQPTSRWQYSSSNASFLQIDQIISDRPTVSALATSQLANVYPYGRVIAEWFYF